MTPERLAKIEKKLTAYINNKPEILNPIALELLAEVKRLRGELERVRGEAVASGGYAQDEDAIITQPNTD